MNGRINPRGRQLYRQLLSTASPGGVGFARASAMICVAGGIELFNLRYHVTMRLYHPRYGTTTCTDVTSLTYEEACVLTCMVRAHIHHTLKPILRWRRVHHVSLCIIAYYRAWWGCRFTRRLPGPYGAELTPSPRPLFEKVGTEYVRR